MSRAVRVRFGVLPMLCTALACAPEAQEPAPEAGVRVLYDELLIPHVFADTDAGVFRGLGFAQARDFPVATLSNLWSASGRFAEVAGASVLPRDERVRRWGIDRRAAELAGDPDELDPEVRGWLAAYCVGVNEGRRLWLESEGLLDRLVGAERELFFDPVPPWLHPLLSKEDPRARLRRLFEAEVGIEHVLALGVALAAGPEFGGGGSSARTNVWLMRGGEEDPATRLLADVHQPLQEFAYRSYPVQLAGPGYDVVGLTAPGLPCVVLGATRALAFASMTLPAKPRELAEAGLPFRVEERAPLVAMAWRGRLEPDAPARLVRGHETLPLVERTVTLRWHDAASGELRDDPRGALVLRWLRDDALEAEMPVLGAGEAGELDLAARPELRFEARSFLGQRSVWETWTRVALCAGVRAPDGESERSLEHALAREWLSIGRGQTLLFGDASGTFRQLWSTRAAALEDRGLERFLAGDTELDGNDPEQRWFGFRELEDTARMPGYAPARVPRGAWIQCNGSPDAALPGAREARAPAEVWDGERWETPRQRRARELFERVDADGVHELAELERMALDVQDQWSRAAWPWIRALTDDAEAPLAPRARELVDWLESCRFERADGSAGDPERDEPFLAHPLSRAMPWLVLARDRYEDELVAARPGADALALAFDPAAPVPAAEELLRAERYEPNRRALRAALEWAGELRARTLAGGPGGLANAAYLGEVAERWRAGGALLPGALAPLLAREPGAAEGAPPPLRWGALNLYALTAHRWSGDAPGADPRRVDAWLASFLLPQAVQPPLPFFRAQTAVAFPSGGTHDSLFQVHRASYRSYARALLARGERLLALAPVDFGSQALFLAELREGKRPLVRVLPALAPTEILCALPELGLGALAPFAVTERFARGEWSTLETDEERLRALASPRSLVLAE